MLLRPVRPRWWGGAGSRPGYLLWAPLSVFVIIFAFIAGGWAAAAGQGMYALVHGEIAPSGAEEPRIWAIG